MPPVKNLSQFTKQDLINKCREYNVAVGNLAKSSRGCLEMKIRKAMKEERAENCPKSFDDIGTHEAASDPNTENSTRTPRPSLDAEKNESSKDDGGADEAAIDQNKTKNRVKRASLIPIRYQSPKTRARASTNESAEFENGNDSGIQLSLSSPPDGNGTLNETVTFSELKRMIQEYEEKYSEDGSGDPDSLKEDEIYIKGPLRGLLKKKLKLNESEDELDKMDDAGQGEEGGQVENQEHEFNWLALGVIIIAGIIFYNIWESILY